MIVNVLDSTISAPLREPGRGSVYLPWHVGSPFPTDLRPNVGGGAIQFMRVIAPHHDLGLLTGLLRWALPSLRPYFVPGGWIEIYGRRVSNTIGGSLAGDNLNTIGGALRRDALNTIGGALRGDRLNTIGGSLGPDRANTIGGSLAPDLVQVVMGTECLCLRP